MAKWIKRFIVTLSIAAVLVALVMAFVPKPVAVQVAEVTRGPMRVTVEAEGQTRVKDRHVVTAPLSGNLGRIELDPADRVEVDTVLARIEPIEPPLLDGRTKAEMKARVQAAEAASRQAEAAVGRAQSRALFLDQQREKLQRLTQAGSVSREELEVAELDAQQAQKELESARFGAKVARHERDMVLAAISRVSGRSSEQFEIRSPIDGVVLRVLRESEGLVQAGTPVLELADPTALEIVADVLTTDAVEIELGDPVAIVRWGGENQLHGRVRLVEPSAFTKISALGVDEQRVNVVIELAEPPSAWQRLGDGYRVEVAIEVWSVDDVVKVPASVLFRGDNAWVVFVVVDGRAALRPVVIGRRSGLEVEVVEGLLAGEVVIVHPTDQVRHGISVDAD